MSMIIVLSYLSTDAERKAHKQNLDVWSLLSAMSIWNLLLMLPSNIFRNFYQSELSFIAKYYK